MDLGFKGQGRVSVSVQQYGVGSNSMSIPSSFASMLHM